VNCPLRPIECEYAEECKATGNYGDCGLASMYENMCKSCPALEGCTFTHVDCPYLDDEERGCSRERLCQDIDSGNVYEIEGEQITRVGAG